MHAAELDRRIDDLARDPGAGEPWDVVRERIEQRASGLGTEFLRAVDVTHKDTRERAHYDARFAHAVTMGTVPAFVCCMRGEGARRLSAAGASMGRAFNGDVGRRLPRVRSA